MCRANLAVVVVQAVLTCAVVVVFGCGGDARVELAAADSIEAAAQQVHVALAEYNAEVAAADRERREAAVAALVERLRADAADEAAMQAHAAAFSEALDALEADVRAEWQRYGTASANVEALVEIAAGLRRVAVSTLTVRDEVRRYLDGLIEARRAAAAETETTP